MRTFIIFNAASTLFVLLLSITGLQTAAAQTWQSLNGPVYSDPGSVTFPGSNLFVQGDTLYYIPMDGAVFKRHVSNEQWSVATTHNPNGYRAFAVDEAGNRYMANHGIVSPTDPPFSLQNVAYVETYNPLWSTIEDLVNIDISDIKIAQNGMALFGGNGIFRLSDDRESLVPIDTLIRAAKFHLYGDTLLAAGKGIAYSVDDGETWSQQDEEPSFLRTVTSVNETIIIATNNLINNQIFVKENLQSEVVEIPNPPDGNFHALHTAGDTVFLGTDTGIFSVDPEELTISESFSDLSGRTVFSIESSGEKLFAATDAGMYSCLISEESCFSDPAPETYTQLVTHWDEQGLLVADREWISLYNEESEEWSRISDQISLRVTNLHPLSADKFLISAGKMLYHCSLEESACDEPTEPDPDSHIVQITETPDGTLVLSTSDRVFLSYDEGEEWVQIYERPVEEFSNIRDLLVYDDSLLLIAQNDSLVRFEISDTGFSTVEYEQSSFIVMEKYGDNLLFGSDGFSLFKSNDAGQSWIPALNFESVENLSGSHRTILTDESSGKIYLQFSSSVILVSDDEGENWGIENSLYPLRVDHSAISDSGDLFLASTGAGVFKNSQPITPPITIANEGDSGTDAIPTEISLHQNYPNPFNPETIIGYHIPAQGEVRLEVFDMLGRRVALLVNGVQRTGEYTVNFNATNLASGIYLYQLSAGSHSEVRKMTIIK